MKYLLAFALILLFCASPAFADYQLDFKDGKSTVWTSYKEKNKQYCTEKEGLGEFCVQKTDVKKITQVADGTEGSEYSASSVGDASNTVTSTDRDAYWRQQDAQDRQDAKRKRSREQQEKQDKMLTKKNWWGE